MAKNITVIVGSPRKNSSSVLLARAFQKGAEAAGHKVNLIELWNRKISGCIGCYGCKKTGRCVLQDDMQPIYDALYQSDALLLSCPVYYFTYPAQVKAVIDRFFASANNPFPIKEAALLRVCAHGDATGGHRMDDEFHALCRYFSWQNRGTIAAFGVWDPHELAGNDALNRAEELGKTM
ncbi:MAG: flavodoxin family protein [Clostridiales bacterium]|nr:flavodoxin family protein [Clostridiales bacterium]